MDRTPKKHSRKATALTNAKPEFVSIVKTGANMMPFRAMKSEDNPENTMQLKTKAATHDIAKLVFKGEAFTEEAAVVAWLEAGGYEGFTVVKAEDGSFSVTDPDAPTEGLVEVETDGVTAFVFQKAASVAKDAAIAAETPTAEGSPSLVTAADGAAVQPVAKEGETNEQGAAAEPNEQPVAEPTVAKTEGETPVVVLVDGALSTAELEALRVKFDEYDVAYSDELTFTDAIADGFDGIPPGFSEVMTAVYAATRNAIIVGQVGSIDSIFADAAACVKKLASIFPADVPMSIDATVFLEEDFVGKDYVVREEGKEPALDEARLRGDLFFPALTVAAPLLAIEAKKEEGGEEVLKQKRDMSDRRKRIQMKAAAKAKPNGSSDDSDGNVQDATANGSNGGANGSAGASKNAKKDTSEAGSAAPEAAGDALTAALTTALAPALAVITELATTMKAATEKAQADADARVAEVKKEAAEAIAAVQKAAVERQTRKAAEADECASGNTVTAKSEQQQRATKSVADMRLRGALGMPRPNR